MLSNTKLPSGYKPMRCEVGEFVKCRDAGWLYEVVEVIPDVPDLFCEQYRLRHIDPESVRSDARQDLVSEDYMSERYKKVNE